MELAAFESRSSTRTSYRQPSANIGIMVGKERITVSEATGILGVVLHQNHLQKVCRAAHARLRNIAQVHSVLPQSVAVTPVHTLITRRLDYCIPSCRLTIFLHELISKLQRVQNSPACVVTRSRRYDHVGITPLLWDLHWLPVETDRFQGPDDDLPRSPRPVAGLHLRLSLA